MGVKGDGESRGKLEESAECAFRMVPPQIRDLDAGRAGRIEVGPLQVGRRLDDWLPGGRPWSRFRLGSRGFLSQDRRCQKQRCCNRQDAAYLH